MKEADQRNVLIGTKHAKVVALKVKLCMIYKA